jgi:uroporphyrinogen decarboxylase
MNSRERVLAALNHQEPDRPPVDFSGHRSSGIAAIAYARLRKHLGLPEKPIRVYDPVQQLAIVDTDVLDLFGIDAVELGRGFALEESCWADWVLPDGTPCQMPAWALPERDGGRWVYRSKDRENIIAHMPAGVLYFEQTFWPYVDGEVDPEDFPGDIPGALQKVMWAADCCAAPPGPLVSDEQLAEGAKKFRAGTDRAIIGLFGGNLLEIGQFLFRNDRFFMLLAGEPEKAHEFLDRLTEMHLRNLEKYLRLVGPSIDILLFGDDLGMQTGPQISPRMYREFFKPRHARLWQRAKELANVKVMLHCCGGVRELLPDLIDAGLDAINPVQITCAGMEARGLKADFGREITFWGGGCDTRSILPYGSEAEIRRHVREQVEILSPGGGFVFQQVHNIMADIPPQNILTMFDTVKSWH